MPKSLYTLLLILLRLPLKLFVHIASTTENRRTLLVSIWFLFAAILCYCESSQTISPNNTIAAWWNERAIWSQCPETDPHRAVSWLTAKGIAVPPSLKKPFFVAYFAPIVRLTGSMSYLDFLNGHANGFGQIARSIFFDAEPWWLYVLTAPAVFWILIKLLVAMGVKNRRSRAQIIDPSAEGPNSRTIWVVIDAFCLAFVIRVFAVVTLSNEHLSLPQMILYVASFPFVFWAGPMVFLRAARLATAGLASVRLRAGVRKRVLYYLALSLVVIASLAFQTYDGPFAGRGTALALGGLAIIVLFFVAVFLLSAENKRKVQPPDDNVEVKSWAIRSAISGINGGDFVLTMWIGLFNLWPFLYYIF